MDLIDLKTAFIIQTFLNFLGIGIYSLLWFQYKNYYEGIGSWALYFIFRFISIFLIILRNVIPNWASILLANLLFLFSLYFLYIGLCKFLQKAYKKIFFVFLLLVFIPIFSFYTFIQNDVNNRIIIFSIAYVILSLHIVHLLSTTSSEFHSIPKGLNYFIIFDSFIVSLRIIFILIFPYQTSNLFHKNISDYTFVIYINLINFFLYSFGLFYLLNRRLLIDKKYENYERKITEEILIQSKLDFHQVASSVPGLVFQYVHRKNGSFSIEYMNETFTTYTGIPFADLKKNPKLFFEPIPREDRDMIKKAIKLASEELKNFKIEHRILTKNGDILWFQVYSIPRIQTNDDVLWSGVSVDITDRINMEEDLLKAKDAAEKANLIKTEFLTNMSHEIRTPINAILGFSELLEARLDNKELISYTTFISQSGRILLALLNDLLELSKIASGVISKNQEPTDLRALLNELNVALYYELSQKQLQYICQIDPDIPDLIIIDKIKLRQILLNLIGNAIKFTSDGFVKVSINKNSEDMKNLSLKILIEDSGIGISEKEQEIIREILTKGVDSKPKKTENPGRGLIVCKRLSSVMDLEISFESQEGKGTKFLLLIKNIETPPSIINHESPLLLPSNPSKHLELDYPTSQIQKWKELYDILVHQYIPIWEMLKDYMVIDDIIKFAEGVNKESSRYAYPELTEWGEYLKISALEYNVQSIKFLLREFHHKLTQLQII
ncbi:MAG: PAS domain-containing protein, partial [Leptospiraceae bacterium]|nr:PAS domain-containing protein [Leptospiraceae bacterium]